MPLVLCKRVSRYIFKILNNREKCRQDCITTAYENNQQAQRIINEADKLKDELEMEKQEKIENILNKSLTDLAEEFKYVFKDKQLLARLKTGKIEFFNDLLSRIDEPFAELQDYNPSYIYFNDKHKSIDRIGQKSISSLQDFFREIDGFDEIWEYVTERRKTQRRINELLKKAEEFK